MKPPFEIAGKDDYQLDQAVNLLKGPKSSKIA